MHVHHHSKRESFYYQKSLQIFTCQYTMWFSKKMYPKWKNWQKELKVNLWTHNLFPKYHHLEQDDKSGNIKLSFNRTRNLWLMCWITLHLYKLLRFIIRVQQETRNQHHIANKRLKYNVYDQWVSQKYL